jgi:hypothetical protein
VNTPKTVTSLLTAGVDIYPFNEDAGRKQDHKQNYVVKLTPPLNDLTTPIAVGQRAPLAAAILEVIVRHIEDDPCCPSRGCELSALASVSLDVHRLPRTGGTLVPGLNCF